MYKVIQIEKCVSLLNLRTLFFFDWSLFLKNLADFPIEIIDFGSLCLNLTSPTSCLKDSLPWGW